MKKIFRFFFNNLLLILWVTPSFAGGPTNSYCTAIYGDDARITFEPMDSNGGAVTNSAFARENPSKRKDGVPAPTGFMCQIHVNSSNKIKCPKGMHLDTKRVETPVCITKKLALQELCPDEIAEIWPELKDTTCKPHSKKK